MDINYLTEVKRYPNLQKCKVAIIGMGYVGLPLAVEIAKRKNCNITNQILERDVIGFDTNIKRISEIKKGYDWTGEISKDELLEVEFSDLTDDINSIANADVFLITVPTPIDESKKPDLGPLKKASISVGQAINIRINNPLYEERNIIPVVIFESTVYPGTTEEICIPLIEQQISSNPEKVKKENFIYGYSPERINPGDKNHRLVDITKVISGNNKFSSKWIEYFYGSIINASIYPAQSIKVAEAAKIIENTQRDLNIALINELSKIFKLMNIDTLDVINAASTKWNFIKFQPGLVGGHCIGVDPYYLTYKSEVLGYSPELLLAGRKMNDGMGNWVAEQIILEMKKKEMNLDNSNILILGFTFKENCPDIRNTKVIDIYKTLIKYNLNIEVVDPIASKEDIKDIYKIDISNKLNLDRNYEVVICAVAHKQFQTLHKEEWNKIKKKKGIFYDLKGIIPRELQPIRI